MQLVEIPAGSFVMGSPATEADSGEDEWPQHEVRISRPFYLGAHEVTQGEFARVMRARPSFFSPTGPGKDRLKGINCERLPVEQVTWHAAVEFCRRLSELPAEKKAGRVYRLPTEAEWEYACRAGTKTTFNFGSQLSSREANFNGSFPYGGANKGVFLARTAEVGSYAPNAWGLFDMHGNVNEWCADWHARGYYRQTPAVDPQGPPSGATRVIRGGDWYSDGRDCRSAFRYADGPEGMFYVVGFRVAMDVGGRGREQVRDASATAQQKHDQPTTRSAKQPTINITGEDWPMWRGPRGDGTWRGPNLPDRWPEGGLRRIWRQPLGGGYAGIAAVGGRVFTMDRQTKPAEVERVICFDAATGKQQWVHEYPVAYNDLSYGNGPRAMPTVYEGDVYCLGSLGQLCCLEATTGKPRWSVELAKLGAKIPMWGLAASPVIFEELVIVHPGVEPGGCFVAFNRHTGKEVWRALSDPAGYATPILVKRGDEAHLICWTPKRICDLDPRSGREQWNMLFEVTYGTAIATPIVHRRIVLVSNYWEGTKAIRLPAVGKAASILWEDNRNLRGLMSQPLCREGYVYLLDKRDGLACVEIESGKKLWDDQNQMTPKGRNPQATMVWTGQGSRALALNSEGELIQAEFTPARYKELSLTKIIGPTWAHPAYAGNRVYARSDEEIVCVELPGAASE